MSRTPESLTPAEVEVLELLSQSELHLPPSVIAYNGQYSRQHYADILQDFFDDGLVDRGMNGTIPYYRINKDGATLLKERKDMESQLGS